MATEIFKLLGKIYIEMDEAEDALNRFEALIKSAVAALESIDGKLTAVNTTLNTMDTRLSEANGELRQLDGDATSANSAINKLDGNVTTLNASMNTFDSRINEVGNELDQFNAYARNAGNQVITMDGAFGRMGNLFSSNGAIGAGAVWLGNILEDLAYKAVDLGWEFMKIGIGFNSSAETYKASFKTMLGVTEKEADALFEKLREFAVETPYSMEGVAESAVRLFNAGYDIDGTMEALEVLGNIAGGDSQKLERLIKAFTDTKGYGFLKAQERNQFVENGVLIYDLLAEYYESIGRGVMTADQIANMQADKAISSDDVWNALVYSTTEEGRYYLAMANLMDTYKGQMEKTGDQLDETAGAFTLPFFDTLKEETLPQLSGLLLELKTWSEENSGVLSEIATSLSGAATGALSKLLELFTFLVERKDALLPILEGVGAVFAVTYATKSPVVAGLGMLLTMATENPDAFDDLTASLSNFATSGLTVFKNALVELLDFFTENETNFNGLLVLLGGLALATNHPIAGAAILGTVYPAVWDDWKENIADPVLEDPEKTVTTAQDNLSSGSTILHYITDTGAYSKEAGAYSRDTTAWERFLLKYAGVLGEDVKRAAEEGMGLVGEDKGGGIRWGQPSNTENTSEEPAWYEKILNWLIPSAGAEGMDYDSQMYERWNPDLRGLWREPRFDLDNPEGTNYLQTLLIGLPAQIEEAARSGSAAGVAESISKISVTGHVTTGNVVLDSGAVVGELTPKINMALGNFYEVSYNDD